MRDGGVVPSPPLVWTIKGVSIVENQEQCVRPFGRLIATETFEGNPKDAFMSLPSGANPILDRPDFGGIGME
jgi:hypothetical protein